ncbi:LysE family translocator [Manganibacter manganicus]|uniref:Threonine transporter n=1 Tax=Manganibacter manganicus TaxID=1873176 RepID=A0A1V8RWD8_9HYPH|nr:LysE family transporter [Pseudaminobacter manganicus]OQM77488.1 threonine transporter [Pseudaminobacter manganicus]
MHPAVVLISVFAIFIPALVLPGPDFIGVVRSSMTHGAKAGLLTAIGVSIGLGFYATLGLAGLSAVLIRFEWLAWLIRIVGGAYLIYLGIKLLLAKPEPVELSQKARRGNPLIFGLGVTLTNPKAIVLFASVFATSVTAATPGWLMAAMIVLIIASSLIWYSIVSLFMSSGPVVRLFSRTRHWIERFAGACFILVGGRILAGSRTPLMP